ncbi:MAG TPA: DsbA family protein [Chthoniobacterales bacterium]|nr:DsbA family protein [Chthoniobacterales bacterium]
MRLEATLYLEVISSWCYWGLSAWTELQKRYADRVAFNWKIALMDASGLPPTREQSEWYYRRSGTIMRSPFMLNAGWFEPGLTEYLAPNLVAEAARDFGITDDRVWSAIAHAALREGQQVAKWEVAAAVGAQAGKLDQTKLLECARSSEVEARARASTAQFHSLQVTQRPTFAIESEIGDRAVFSGIATLPPLIATIEAMLEDLAAYDSHAAHFGAPPLL